MRVFLTATNVTYWAAVPAVLMGGVYEPHLMR
jgi:hypothetical protein